MKSQLIAGEIQDEPTPDSLVKESEMEMELDDESLQEISGGCTGGGGIGDTK